MILQLNKVNRLATTNMNRIDYWEITCNMFWNNYDRLWWICLYILRISLLYLTYIRFGTYRMYKKKGYGALNWRNGHMNVEVVHDKCTETI